MKNGLVFLDQGDDSDQRLEFGLVLAERLGSHLTTVALTLEPALMFAGGAMAANDLLVREMEQARAETAALAARISTRLERAGGAGHELRSACLSIGAVADTAARHARYADFSVVGAPREDGPVVAQAIFDGALFSSGRPIIVTPPQADASKLLDRVVIAWDGGRFAARAVFDAMPLIKRATEVSVVVVDPMVSSDAHGDEPGGDIALSLARHDVQVDVRQLPRSGRTVGAAILSHARDWNAGLIVMGGYGHSPLRESLFGGVSREVIDSSPTPLFMSH